MARTSARLGSSRSRDRSAALDWYEERDRALVRTTVAFGVTWGVSLILTGVFVGLAENAIEECDVSTLDTCPDNLDSARKLLVPGYAFAVVAGLSGFGTILSGGLLGGHRGSRPYLSAGGGRRWASVGFGARF